MGRIELSCGSSQLLRLWVSVNGTYTVLDCPIRWANSTGVRLLRQQDRRALSRRQRSCAPRRQGRPDAHCRQRRARVRLRRRYCVRHERRGAHEGQDRIREALFVGVDRRTGRQPVQTIERVRRTARRRLRGPTARLRQEIKIPNGNSGLTDRGGKESPQKKMDFDAIIHILTRRISLFDGES